MARQELENIERTTGKISPKIEKLRENYKYEKTQLVKRREKANKIECTTKKK